LASSLRIVTKRPLLLGALLLVTIFGMITAVIVTSRSYEASGEVLLLPAPEVPPSTDPTVPAPSTNNPYLRLELSDVADALSARVSSAAQHDRLVAQGLQGSYELVANADFQRGPILTLKVTSTSQAAALDGYRLLSRATTSNLREMQVSAGANPAFLISSQDVANPAIASATLLARMRAGLVALVLGLILSLVVLFAIDALGVRRGRAATEVPDATTDPVPEELPAEVGATTDASPASNGDGEVEPDVEGERQLARGRHVTAKSDEPLTTRG
jgi:hypothetical protein